MIKEARGDCSNLGLIYVPSPRLFMHPKLFARKDKWDGNFKVLGIGGSRVNEGHHNPGSKLFETRFPLDPSRSCNIAEIVNCNNYIAILMLPWENALLRSRMGRMYKFNHPEVCVYGNFNFRWPYGRVLLWNAGASFECHQGCRTWDPASNVKQRFTSFTPVPKKHYFDAETGWKLIEICNSTHAQSETVIPSTTRRSLQDGFEPQRLLNLVWSIYQMAKLVLHIICSLLLFNFSFSFLTLDVTTYFAANIYFPFFTNWFGCLTFFIVVLSCFIYLISTFWQRLYSIPTFNNIFDSSIAGSTILYRIYFQPIINQRLSSCLQTKWTPKWHHPHTFQST